MNQLNFFQQAGLWEYENIIKNLKTFCVMVIFIGSYQSNFSVFKMFFYRNYRWTRKKQITNPISSKYQYIINHLESVSYLIHHIYLFFL